MGKITVLIMTMVMIYVGLIFIGEFAPDLGNVTYTEGGVAGTIFDIAKWLVPLMAILGLLVVGIKKFMSDAD